MEGWKENNAGALQKRMRFLVKAPAKTLPTFQMDAILPQIKDLPLP